MPTPQHRATPDGFFDGEDRPTLATVHAILDSARWAPSVDNTQPWRFELRPDAAVVVHGFDTRDSCVYDLDGRVSQLSLGALLETARIAATAHGVHCAITQREGMPDACPTFDLRFRKSSLRPDRLIDSIKVRSVQRRPLRTRPLTIAQRQELEASVAEDFQIRWLASFPERLGVAKMLFLNGQLRLRLPEAFEVHRRIIEWDADESIDRMPDRAIGLDPVSLRVTRWALASWSRVSFLDRYLGGTLVPSFELDFLPGIACAAHFVIVASTPPRETPAYIDGGRALQRFWLTATKLGLLVQPEASPLVFARYHREGRHYTSSKPCEALARRVIRHLTDLVGEDCLDHAVFMGRIGSGAPPKARSTRLPLTALYKDASGSHVG
jgi:sulfur-carrier protein adenylyltransferase/sulfurtransferase